MKAIINGNIVLEDRILEDGILLIDGDHIHAIGTQSEISIPEGCEIIDAKGHLFRPRLCGHSLPCGRRLLVP